MTPPVRFLVLWVLVLASIGAILFGYWLGEEDHAFALPVTLVGIVLAVVTARVEYMTRTEPSGRHQPPS